MPRTNYSDNTENSNLTETKNNRFTINKQLLLRTIVEGINTQGMRTTDDYEKILLEFILGLFGKNLKSFKNPAEIKKFLETKPLDKTIEEIEQENQGELQTVKPQKKEFEAKVLDAELRKQLLRELEEKEMLTAERVAQEVERLNNISIFHKNFGRNEIERIIQKKIALQKAYEERLKTENNKYQEIVTKKADILSDSQIVLGAFIEDENKVEEIVGRIEERKEDTKEQITKTLSTIPEIKRDSLTKKQIIEITEAARGESVVEEYIQGTSQILTDKLVDDLQTNSENEKSAIKKIVENRIRERISGDNYSLSGIRSQGSDFGKDIFIEIKEVSVLPERIDQEKARISEIINRTEKEVLLFASNNSKSVDLVRREKIGKEIWEDITNKQEDAEIKTIVKAVKVTQNLFYPISENIESPTKTIFKNDVDLSGFQENGLRAFKSIVQSPVKVNEKIAELKKVESLLDPKSKLSKSINGLTVLLERNPVFAKMLQISQKLSNTNQLVGGAFVWTGKKLGWKLMENTGTWISSGVGMQPGHLFILESVKVIRGVGSIQKALPLIADGVLKGGVNAARILGTTATGAQAAAGAGTAAASTGWLATILGSGPAAPVVAVAMTVVALAKVAWDAGVWVNGKINDFMDKTFGFSARAINPVRIVKKFVEDNIPIFGKFGGWLLTIPEKMFEMIANMSLSTALVAVILVIISVAVPLSPILLPMGAGGLIASIIPPSEMGGGANCVVREAIAGDGNINCNLTVPDDPEASTYKENFISVAERWTGGRGKSYARECFNDVVARAKSAGMDPRFALMIWLNESDASNYTMGNSRNMDFGINMPDVPTKNFNAQITRFLQLKHSGCASVGDFWLGWATNYLTGGCDPDKQVTGGSGRTYYQNIKDRWTLLFGGNLPTTIWSGQNSNSNYQNNEYPFDFKNNEGQDVMCNDNTGPYGVSGPGIPQPTRDPKVPVPEGCPDGWPLKTTACINQGPYGGFSHKVIEALDFGLGCLHKNLGGAEIVATHDGVVTGGGGEGNVYGYYVDVTSTCKGKTITTRYAHMPAIEIQQNSQVKKGQVIGHVNNSGTFRSPNNEHLHYEIIWRALPILQNIPPVKNPNQLYGCNGFANCGSNIINQ